MMRTTPARIAWRYLWAKKSHSAVSAISAISICGMAVATAAIVCVLSVFNGFREVMESKLDILAPDVMVTPAEGKVIADADSAAAAIARIKGVATVMPEVTDNALVIYNSREMPVTLKGVVPDVYSKITKVDSIILEGGSFITSGGLEPEPVFDEWGDEVVPAEPVTLAIGAAMQLGRVMPGDSLLLFAPKREGRVNLANPVTSFVTGDAVVTGVYQAQQSQYDENTVICDIETARRLFQYDAEATAIDVKAEAGEDIARLADRIGEALGGGFVVKDRLKQQETHFRMVAIEKWVSFLLLFFILVIASFNIISTLSMLVIDKQKSLSTLSALGMSRKDVGNVFWWESIYVSLAGGASGIALGTCLCLLQRHFGFLKLNGDSESLVVSVYPVAVEAGDLALTVVPVVLIGLATAFISSGFARTRIS